VSFTCIPGEALRTTRCKHCREKFTPERTGQIVHAACIEGYMAAQIAKRQRQQEAKRRAEAKVERAETRRRKEALKRIPDLIADAQEAFNAFIRARDKGKGCFVCGRPFAPVPGQVQHAGHVRSRGAAGHLRFHEDNVLGECEGCNGPHGARPHQIKAGAIARIGQAAFDALENDNTPHKWTREELVEIKTTYRQKLRELQKKEAECPTP
jgi:hypothetical protein